MFVDDTATFHQRSSHVKSSGGNSNNDSDTSMKLSTAYCLYTDDLEQRLLLAKDDERAAFHERTGRVFAALIKVARQRIHATVLDRRRKAGASSLPATSTASSTTPSTTTGTGSATKPRSATTRRVHLVASEQRFIAALHTQSKHELDAHCERTRDRTVAESFADEQHTRKQTQSVGDARLAQIRADFYDGFEPHEGQIALFEMLCEQLGSRIYAEEWERDWRSICQRNRWHNRRLRLGFSASIMPRRTGKTTVGSRSGLAFAMNIPRWKGVIIGTSLETAAYTVDEMEKQFYLCARGVRDFKFVRTAAGIAMAPYSNPMDVRTWLTIPGEV